MRAWLVVLAACGSSGNWLTDTKIFVDSTPITNLDCRTDLCVHSENTDLTVWGDAIYLVHRTAESQILGPNSSLRVYRSDDHGATFTLFSIIPAPIDRDIRDPSFYIIDGKLAIKTLTRLPVNSTRDSNVDTIAMNTTSSDDGHTWSPLQPIGPETWSYWRIKDDANGVHYTAAYEDGDSSIRLFTSTDGLAWTMGASIYDVAADTPGETELVFMPSGQLLALVRMDGTDDEILGAQGRLRTMVCWATPPYASFSCPQTLDGVRLDGPVAWLHGDRLFVIARKHIIGVDNHKRTALYEIGGGLDGGELSIVEHGELPSAGDTSYAGVAPIDDHRVVVTWYSSSIAEDEPWARAIFGPTDIWQGIIDVSEL
jgi:hypothetical protein